MSERPRVLLTGLALGESPRWHDGRLWFSDWLAYEIVAVDLDGKRETMVTMPPSFPFSFDWLPDGTMVVTSGSELVLHRVTSDGSLEVHTDLHDLLEFGCNEIVVDGRGYTYVNSVGFDMMGGAPPQPGQVLVITPEGSARKVAGGVMFPNGMVVTPDDGTLVVGESYGNQLTGFTIQPNGDLSDAYVWADAGDGVPDGMTVDAEGAIWYADVPNQRCVRVAEGGEVLQSVDVGLGCFACMLGGPDGTTLFIVAAEWKGPEGMGDGSRTGQILTVPAPAPRAGHP